MKPENYQPELKLSVRAICHFEALRDKPYAEANLESEDDIFALLYSMYDVASGGLATEKDFRRLYELDPDTIASHIKTLKRIFEHNQQFAPKLELETDPAQKKEQRDFRMASLACRLIIDGGLQASYVMDTMELWEVQYLLKALEEKKKEAMERDRLWTFYQILPHIDGKKIKNPQDMFPFPWETDEMLERKTKDDQTIQAELSFLENAHNIKCSLPDRKE